MIIGLILLLVFTNQLEAELKVEGKPKDLRKISGTAEFDGMSKYTIYFSIGILNQLCL